MESLTLYSWSTILYADAIVKEKGLTVFEEHLNELGIKHIVGRVNHPQTNGKTEMF